MGDINQLKKSVVNLPTDVSGCISRALDERDFAFQLAGDMRSALDEATQAGASYLYQVRELRHKIDGYESEKIHNTIHPDVLMRLKQATADTTVMDRLHEWDRKLKENKNQIYTSNDSTSSTSMSDPTTVIYVPPSEVSTTTYGSESTDTSSISSTSSTLSTSSYTEPDTRKIPTKSVKSHKNRQ